MTLSSETRPQDGAESTTARVADVLLAFAGADSPLGITDVARATNLSKAVVHRIVQTLCSKSFVWQDPVTRKYRLGMAAFALADSANQASEFRRIGMSILADLTEATGETTTLSGRVGHRRVYVGQVESRQLVRISVQVGTALPLTVGASGAAILAFLPDNEIEAALAIPIPMMSEYTVTEPSEVRARLREVVRDGYAHTTNERVKDSTGFAAPVWSPSNEVVGCISIAALTSRLTPEREEDLGQQVIRAATTLTERLRGRIP
ncbi:IclR family transcriptional regulator [Ornithinimicrobium faecis]|uniref:IclR family transcriptional regulator n=1 Tax=Ornithinimicrobium faecis TaxID=2934158 RepID=A0ABY4YTP0_9MICO|nr:IclR family transcriptional regulator [Ornithinimicrobium sp. HY1793]USQ80131.1 IclR family transcriptional regulator [Ornithinimicrobium sp. HY1793]